MDDGRGKRARHAKRVHVRHHVMPVQKEGHLMQQKNKQVLNILLSSGVKLDKNLIRMKNNIVPERQKKY